MNFCERIKYMREHLGLSQAQMALELGLNQKTISHWEKGRNEPSNEALRTFCSKYKINLNWLLAGEGSILLNECNILPFFAPDNDLKDEVLIIPFYNANAAAGCGAFNDGVYIYKYVPFNKNYIRKILKINHDNLSLICARGDSMEPTIKEGDILLINELDQTPNEEGIYVFSKDDLVSVKRLLIISDDEIKVSSDNKVYDSVIINLEKNKIVIIGKVVWHAKKVI